MKIDNQSFGFDNASCGALENPLFASSAAGWRRGYAADCKSVRPIQLFQSKINDQPQSDRVDKTPGHIANQDGTLKTLPPGFACIASIICGALVWVYIAAGWL
jgi:hypothetical protein